MKRILSILLALLIAAFALVSCNSQDSGDGTSGGNDQTTDQPSGGNTDTDTEEPEVGGWKKGDIVYYRGDKEAPFKRIQDGFTSDTVAFFAAEGGGEGDKLFILGEYDSPVYEKAYMKLDKDFTEAKGSAIFTIYTDGSSVAIAYSSLVARHAALDYFFDNFESLNLSKAGVIVSHEFDVKEYLTEMRTSQREEEFAAISENFSEDAMKEFRNLYSLYDERAYVWLANLWDPDIGAFYYSQSARNTQGFLPDLESTAQALLFLSESGMVADYEGSYAAALPDDMAASIIKYVKESQDPIDGYFYHKQWGKSVGDNRLGRDLGWATRMLYAFGTKPYWDTKNGVDGEFGAPGKVVAPTASLRLSPAVAVSMVVPTAAEYLDSLELFKKHLEEDFDWETNSYAAGNAIESDIGQIQNADKEYAKALISFLNSKQKENGLWEDEITYDSVNGLMKISAVYTSLGVNIPRAKEAMASALQMLKSTDKVVHVCSVYNPWEAVSNVLNTIEKTAGVAECAELRAQFRAEAAELIRITAEKLATFKKADGGFSYYIKYSAANSQGSAVAVDKSEESDVNATMICTNSTIRAMFEVFGVNQVARYTTADYARFSDELLDLGTIIKDEILPAEKITFDHYDSVWGEEEGGVSKLPDDYAENKIGDLDMENGDYKWFESEVVKNPDPAAKKGDLVLRSKSKVCVGEEKSLADKPSSTRFFIPNAGLEILGNCYVYDADMYFTPGYGKTSHTGKATSDPIIQLFFMTESLPCSSLNFSVYTEDGVDYVKIGENYAGLDGKESNIAGKIPMGEWVNIRVEYYKNYETNDKGETVFKPVMKIFVNGKFQGDCDATITGANTKGELEYYDRKVDQVSISYYRFLSAEVYFNNVLAERCNKKYVAEINPDAMVEPIIPDEEMRESYGFEDGLLNTSNVVNKVRVVYFGVSKYINASEGQTYNSFISYSLAKDPKNEANNVLKVVASRSDKFDKPSRTEVNLHNSAAEGEVYAFSGKFYYPAEEIGTAGDLTQIFFFNSLENALYSIRIAAVASDGGYTISIFENNADGGTGNGKTIAEGISCDEWFSLKIAMSKTGKEETTGADIYLNDDFLTRDRSYRSDALAQAPVLKVCISHQKTNNSTVYLDDLSFTKDGEIAEVVISKDRVMDFEQGFNSLYLTSYSYNNGTKLSVLDIDPNVMEELYTKFYLYNDPKNEANRVLRMVNKNGGTKAGYTEVKISNENPVGDCYTFETKMYIDVASAGYNVTQLKIVNKDGAEAFNAYVSIDKNTNNLKIATTGNDSYPTKGTNIIQNADIAVKKGEWFTIRAELYHKGTESNSTNTYLKLYINDKLAFDGVAYSALGVEVSHVEILCCNSAKSSAIYLDDVSFSRTDKEYSKD